MQDMAHVLAVCVNHVRGLHEGVLLYYTAYAPRLCRCTEERSDHATAHPDLRPALCAFY